MSDAKSLAAAIGAEPTRTTVIDGCVSLVDGEVSAKKGVSGFAIKGAYKTVKAIKPGFVRGTVDSLLDPWLERLQPFHDEWRDSGSGTFTAFLSARADDVAEAMLSVTDEAAQNTKHKTAGKLYGKLRGSAKTNVSGAVPQLGALSEPHL